MKLNELVELGIAEDVAEKVMAIHAESMKGFIPKTRFDEVNNTKKDLEQQIKDRDAQLTDINAKVKGNSDLEEAIKKLQEENDQTKTQYEAKIRELAINSVIQSKLTDTKYPDLLITKFDKSKLVVAEDGTVNGVDEQLNAIKETYKDLFTPVVKGKEPNNNGTSKPNVKNPWSKEHFNLTEQAKIYRDNPELAKQLKDSAI